MKKLIVGSWDSRLAILQAERIMQDIHKKHPDIRMDHKIFHDGHGQMLMQSVLMETGKESKVTELDLALVKGEIDISIEDLADMVGEEEKLLPIVAYTSREDARDCLIARDERDHGAERRLLVIGATGKGRLAQLSSLYRDARIVELSGTLESAIKRMDAGDCEGIVLPVTVARCMGLEGSIMKYFDAEELVPSAGQGITVIRARSDLDASCLKEVDEQVSRLEFMAERAYIKELWGEDSNPLAAYGCIKNNKLYLTGMYYQKATGRCFKESVIGYRNEAEKLGVFFANYMRRRYRM